MNKKSQPDTKATAAPKHKNAAHEEQPPAKQVGKSRSSSSRGAESAAAKYPAPETVGGHESVGKARKRRHNHRRKDENAVSTAPIHQSNPAVDPDELVAHAWEIFKGEVTEEGLALMDDDTATETVRRAFRLAEIFLVEAVSRRTPDKH